MKVIINNIIPFKGFIAINLFGVVFARHEPNKQTLRHEAIHTAQVKELLYVGFYFWYGLEWLIRFLICFNAMKAYYNIGFEKEAYINQGNKDYLNERKKYAFIKYL